MEYTKDPYLFVAGTVLEDGYDPQEAGFFHVTTQRDRVAAEGLKSRSQTGFVGLGGGEEDPGRHVSFSIRYSSAIWLYEAMVTLRMAVEISAVACVEALLHWTEFPQSDYYSDMIEFLSEDAEFSGDEPFAKFNRRVNELLDVPSSMDFTDIRSWRIALETYGDSINHKWPTPTARYLLTQELELAILVAFYLEAQIDTEEPVCSQIAGFTATSSQFLRIDPRQISIVQAEVAKLKKAASIIPNECELRFRPEDVRVIAMDCQNPNNVR